MLIIVGYLLFGLFCLRFLVLVVNYFSRPYLPERMEDGEQPMISVLVPARNEEKNLQSLLADLKEIDYPNFEVILCNDQSTDGSEALIQAFRADFPSLQYFNNEPLPEGWMGKNFACYQLARRARGAYLLFIDADVRIRPSLLKKAVAYTQRRKLKLLSMFPQQIIETAGEWKTVPVMNWILLSFLPLPLVRLRWFSSLSAANGQMMFFEAASYREHQWHQKLKSQAVEDILIARNMKKQKLPIAVLLGNNDMLCRMYRSYDEALEGFSRNVHQFFGGSRWWLFFFLLMVWGRLFFFLVLAKFFLFFSSLVMLFLMKIMYSNLSRFPLAKSLRFHFQQMLALTRMVRFNFSNRMKKQLRWKGRVYRVDN